MVTFPMRVRPNPRGKWGALRGAGYGTRPAKRASTPRRRRFRPPGGLSVVAYRRLNYSAIAAETRRDRSSRSTKHLERSRPLRLPGS